MNATTGQKSTAATGTSTYTIPGASLPASGVYLGQAAPTRSAASRTRSCSSSATTTARPRRRSSSCFRRRPTRPTTTWGGKSLYFDSDGGGEHGLRHRPRGQGLLQPPATSTARRQQLFFGPTSTLVQWLEQQGYDVSYTDDVSVHADPGAAAASTTTLVVSGHCEYWSRRAVQRLQGGARRRRQHRLLQRQHRLLEGPLRGRRAHARLLQDRPGRRLDRQRPASAPTTGARTASRAPPTTRSASTGSAGTADDQPENSTTTFRDNGAPPGDPNAPPGGRVGPDMPENPLFGRHVRRRQRQLATSRSPSRPANADGEYAGDRIWRNTGISDQLDDDDRHRPDVGWEWDAIPTQAQYLVAPARRRQALTAATSTRPRTSSWLQDEGRVYANDPAAGPAGDGPARSSTPPPAARWSSPPARTTGPTRSRPTPTAAASSRRPTTSSPTWASSRDAGRHHPRPARRQPAAHGLASRSRPTPRRPARP